MLADYEVWQVQYACIFGGLERRESVRGSLARLLRIVFFGPRKL